MTVGDKSANSYGWSSTLLEAVPDGGEVTFPAPGFDEQYTDVRYAEATVGGIGEVWRTGDGKVDITFVATEPYSVTVANHSGVEWPPAASIYVFCPHLLSEGHNQYDVKGQIWDLQKRVSALEGGTKAAPAAHAPAQPKPAQPAPPVAPPRPPAQAAHAQAPNHNKPKGR